VLKLAVNMTPNKFPPEEIVEKLISHTIVKYNNEVVENVGVEKSYSTNKGNYYWVCYSINPNADFNLYQTNLQILKLYHDTFDRMSKYLGIEKKHVIIYMSHGFFKIRKFNNSLILQTNILL
jgi:hypothetical protein